MYSRTAQPRRSALGGGFTLLELVLVLLLMAVAVGIVMPSLSNTARGRHVSDTAADMITLTNYAHNQAIAEGKAYRLNLDANGAGFWLTMQQDDGQFVELGQEMGQRIEVPEGVRLESDLPRQQDGGIFVTFRPTGRCEPAPVNVRLSDQTGNVTQITCESATELFHIVTNQANRR